MYEFVNGHVFSIAMKDFAYNILELIIRFSTYNLQKIIFQVYFTLLTTMPMGFHKFHCSNFKLIFCHFSLKFKRKIQCKNYLQKLFIIYFIFSTYTFNIYNFLYYLFFILTKMVSRWDNWYTMDFTHYKPWYICVLGYIYYDMESIYSVYRFRDD